MLVRQAPGVSNAEFRRYMTDSLAAQVARSEHVLKFRLHLFEPPDLSRPDAAGVVHFEPPERQYQAAYELAFRNHLDMERFFASPEYAAAVRDEPRFVEQVSPFPERNPYTFVYDGRMTLAGQRGSRTAELITRLGATNQLRADIHDLVVGGCPTACPLAARQRPAGSDSTRRAQRSPMRSMETAEVATNGNRKSNDHRRRTRRAHYQRRIRNGKQCETSSTESAPQLLPGSCSGLFHAGAGPQAYCGSADRGR